MFTPTSTVRATTSLSPIALAASRCLTCPACRTSKHPLASTVTSPGFSTTTVGKLDTNAAPYASLTSRGVLTSTTLTVVSISLSALVWSCVCCGPASSGERCPTAVLTITFGSQPNPRALSRWFTSWFAASSRKSILGKMLTGSLPAMARPMQYPSWKSSITGISTRCHIGTPSSES